MKVLSMTVLEIFTTSEFFNKIYKLLSNLKKFSFSLISMDESDKKAWKGFVDSVRSKLTVAQVVDGVKGSAELTFDYLLLILTAE